MRTMTGAFPYLPNYRDRLYKRKVELHAGPGS